MTHAAFALTLNHWRFYLDGTESGAAPAAASAPPSAWAQAGGAVMSRRVYAGAIGHERTLVLRHEDEGRVKYELVPLFRPTRRESSGRQPSPRPDR